MKFRSSTVIVLTALTFVLSAMVPLASADNDGMHVIMLGPEGQFEGKQQAKVQIQVFEKDKRVDPDQTPIVEFRTGYSYSDGDTRDITAVKKETGIYEATIDIYDSDTDKASYGSVSLKNTGNTSEYEQYALSYGRASDNDTAFDFTDRWNSASSIIQFAAKEGLKIEFDFKNVNDAPWGPGEKVQFDIYVTNGGKAVKPDDFDVGEDVSPYSDDDDIVYARAPTASEEPKINVLFNTKSDGYYQAEFTIPATLKEEHSFDVTAYAKLGDKLASDGFSINVQMFLVWAHIKSPLNSKAKDFDVYVSDMGGKKVAGAAMTFSYYSGGGDGYSTRASTYGEKNATTDAEGKSSFSFKDIDSDLSINGEVTKDGKTQSFSGTVDYSTGTTTNEDDEEPSNYGFDVITHSDTYKPTGSQVTHPFIAFYDGESLANKDVYYYAKTDTEVLGFGTAKTNAKGEFNVNFKKLTDKMDSVDVQFECPINYHPGVWEGYGWEDTDNDGFSDKFETYLKTDPKDEDSYPNTYKDSDGDLFGDQYETSKGTDPKDEEDFPHDFNDTDNDGFGDEFEVDQDTDPDSSWDHPSDYPDNDSDGHSNAEENFYGTDIEDEDEFPHDTYKQNSDDDYTIVGWFTYDYQYDDEEKFYGTDPKDAESTPNDIYSISSDYDGVVDEEEKWFGTDPEDSSSSPDSQPYSWDSRYDDHNSTDGWTYETDAEYISEEVDVQDLLNDDRTTISVSKFKIGGTSKVTVSTKDTPYLLFADWMMGDISKITSPDDVPEVEWEPWTYDSLEMYPVGSKHQGVLIAPEFLPAGSQKYTILGGYMDMDGVHYNNIVVKNGESKSSAETDDTILGFDSTVFMAVSISVVALLVIIIIVVIIVIVVVKGKKKSPTTNPSPAPAPAQGATDTPPPPPPGFNPQGQPGQAPPAQPGAPAQPAQPGAQPVAPGQPATTGQPPGQQAPPPDPTLFPQGQTYSQPGQPQVQDQGNYPPPPPPKQY